MKTKKVKIFSQATRIDEDRQVSITEVPHEGLSIEAMTRWMGEDGSKEVAYGRMSLSEDTAEALFSILGDWMKHKLTKKRQK